MQKSTVAFIFKLKMVQYILLNRRLTHPAFDVCGIPRAYRTLYILTCHHWELLNNIANYKRALLTPLPPPFTPRENKKDFFFNWMIVTFLLSVSSKSIRHKVVSR